jgi:hypothetical protein
MFLIVLYAVLIHNMLFPWHYMLMWCITCCITCCFNLLHDITRALHAPLHAAMIHHMLQITAIAVPTAFAVAGQNTGEH